MTAADAGALPARVAVRLAARARMAAGDRVVVALSGGLDSLVLLHLLRFADALPRVELVAAHFDHRMRAGSAADARWVVGLAHAWQVPIEVGAARTPPASEEAARDARYAFLEAVRVRSGARWIVTAHHADDQAETVLFRIARGTGLAGLRGIPARRGALLRPLLPFWREEIEAYAVRARITPRPDPSNADPRFARNALRGELIPRLEAAVSPGARRSLVRLALLAAREERAWRGLVADLLDQVVIELEPTRIVVARPVLLEYPAAVQARVLRALLRRLGAGLGESGTRAALEFTRAGTSGRTHPLPGGLLLSREFDRLVFAGADDREPDGVLEIRGAGSGEGRFEMGGRRLAARWSLGALRTEREAEAFALARLEFPLRFRSRRPGDRIRLSYGSKKLKKLLSEAGIPLSERGRVPVLVDSGERVLWLPGVARGTGMEPGPGEVVFHIGIRDEGRV